MSDVKVQYTRRNDGRETVTIKLVGYTADQMARTLWQMGSLPALTEIVRQINEARSR